MARRRSKEPGARIELDKKAFQALVKAGCTQFSAYLRDWGYRSDDGTVFIATALFDAQAFEALQTHLQQRNDMHEYKWLLGQLRAHAAALSAPDKALVTTLPALETAMRAWLKQDVIRGWVFVKRASDSKTMQAMLAVDVKFHEREAHISARTVLTLEYWGPDTKFGESAKTQSHTVRFEQADLQKGMPLKQLLINRGLFHESNLLLNVYDRDEKRFLQWRSMLGTQFVGTGEFNASDPNREDRYNFGDAFDLEMNGARIVVDDDAEQVENRSSSEVFASADDENEAQTQLPLAFLIDCFNLRSHRNGHVHIDDMTLYVYRPELREKLILPEEHSDLIDALTTDMDVLQEDIVEGKSGGTTILCQGIAGTGKTLTAEVYAEIIKRPLYRVHSGQLGTDAATVEKALQEALDRAVRWGAPLLIDEADVFIAKRGTDLAMNAVVGVFLRILEYYAGLLFLTTNRTDTIDEAILSRCIAIIKYEPPEISERSRIWEVLGAQYGLKLIEDVSIRAKLAKHFVCTGRDIKGLVRLVMKYSHARKRAPAFDDFKRFAVFKGITYHE